jgi:hypothetical protein
MTRLQTNPEPDVRPATDTTEPAASGDWSPLGAWRASRLYGPLARAVRDAAGDATRARVLVVGGSARALAALLAGEPSPSFEVEPAEISAEGALAIDDRAFDLVVAVDAVSAVAASRRERAVAELCRVARLAVLVADAFDAPAVVAAERAVNDAYRAARGADHPRLGRRLEMGLPDLDAARRWIGERFAHVDAAGLDEVAVWRAGEGLAILSAREVDEPSPADVAASALFPAPARAAGPAYRTLLVGAARPVALPADDASGAASEVGALLMHHAAELAAHRASFDRLAAAITAEREREREEFRATVESLAAELREREANAEFLAREIRKRDALVADHHATVAALERHLSDTAVHARNVEAHAENATRDAERYAAEAAALSDAARDAEHRLRDLEARLAEAETRARTAEQALEFFRTEHERLLESRGGKALTGYVRFKRALFGRDR